MAPVYDVVPTTAFLGGQRHLGMSVNRGFRIERVTRGDLVAEAVRWGVPAPIARGEVESALQSLDDRVADADASSPDLEARVRLQVTGQLFRMARPD